MTKVQRPKCYNIFNLQVIRNRHAIIILRIIVKLSKSLMKDISDYFIHELSRDCEK